MTTTIDPTYAEMLAPILADPSDDAPRLTMADWLEENGEPERAEFIRVQCELATRDADTVEYCDMGAGLQCGKGGICRLRLRDGELLTGNYGLRWAMPLLDTMGWSKPAALVGSWIWSRGFISQITCTAADWITHAEAILAEHPAREVRLTTSMDNAATEFNQVVFHRGYVRLMGMDIPISDPFDWGKVLRFRWPGITFVLPPYIQVITNASSPADDGA